jgi:uncharacterized membrane protein
MVTSGRVPEGLAYTMIHKSAAAEVGSVVAVMVCSALLLMFRLDNPILWVDEVFTTNYIRHGYDFLIDFARPDERHPPGHYLTLKAWSQVFGEDRVGVRSMSIAWAVLCLPLLYGIVRLRFDKRTALIAICFLALFPGFVYYGREARMYAQLFGLLSLASFLFFYLFDRFQRLGGVKRAFLTLCFSVALAGTFYTHYISFIFYSCFSLAAVALSAMRKDVSWFLYALAGIGVATLLAVPQIFHMLKFVAPATDEWIPYSDLRIFYSTLLGTYDAPTLAKPLLYFSYLLGLVYLWRSDKELTVFLGVFLVLGPILLGLIGAVRPVLLVRTLQPFSLFAPILIALVATRVPWSRIGVALAMYVATVNAITFSAYFPAQRQNLFAEEALAVMTSFSPQQDEIFYIEHLQPQFELMRIDYSDFRPVGFNSIAEDEAVVLTHLERCQSKQDCGKTVIILEGDPLFEKQAGTRWTNFARSLGPSEVIGIEGYFIYVIE